MAWHLKSGEKWSGGVHELGDRTWSGETRTSESRELVWREPVVLKKVPKRSKRGRKPIG